MIIVFPDKVMLPWVTALQLVTVVGEGDGVKDGVRVGVMLGVSVMVGEDVMVCVRLGVSE
jgi:hypothetical protein